jgi:hypothetical protein
MVYFFRITKIMHFCNLPATALQTDIGTVIFSKQILIATLLGPAHHSLEQ